MLWVTSMLVSHPNNSILMDRLGEDTVTVAMEVGTSGTLTIGVFVSPVTGIAPGAVDVATTGVGLLTAITTGVGETIDGVFVGGRNGVGGE
jgi:hypothetical protein